MIEPPGFSEAERIALHRLAAREAELVDSIAFVREARAMSRATKIVFAVIAALLSMIGGLTGLLTMRGK